MKYITILCGIPCSGKSTFANCVLGEVDHPGIVLSRDSIRDKYNLHQYTHESESKVTEYYNMQLDEVIQDSNVEFIILDNTYCKTKYIDYIINTFSEEHFVTIIFFDISLIKSYYRNIKRFLTTGKWIPFKIINNMYKSYNKIDKEKYEEYIYEI